MGQFLLTMTNGCTLTIELLHCQALAQFQISADSKHIGAAPLTSPQPLSSASESLYAATRC